MSFSPISLKCVADQFITSAHCWAYRGCFLWWFSSWKQSLSFIPPGTAMESWRAGSQTNTLQDRGGRRSPRAHFIDLWSPSPTLYQRLMEVCLHFLVNVLHAPRPAAGHERIFCHVKDDQHTSHTPHWQETRGAASIDGKSSLLCLCPLWRKMPFFKCATLSQLAQVCQHTKI